jgi:hypothetical protein
LQDSSSARAFNLQFQLSVSAPDFSLPFQPAFQPIVSPLVPCQAFNQQKDFGGHRVMQFRLICEGGVAAASDDGLEGADEGQEPSGGLWIGGALLEEGGDLGQLAAAQGLGYGEADAAPSRR